MSPRHLLLTPLFLLTACDERQVPTDTGAVADLRLDTAAPDQQVLPDAPRPDKAMPAPDLTPLPDKTAIPDGNACNCVAPQVYLRGACVPNEKLGCGSTCTPGGCPKNQVCDKCAASPTCASSACRAACVPSGAMGFSPGSLRVTPTQGVAGKAVTLTVTGGTFYIGALWWVMRLGTIETNVKHSGNCTATATFVPPKPGLYPVEVRYGASGGKGSLAGFYLASGGSIPPPTAQPGHPCSAKVKCAQAKPYTCSCVKGRCKCSK